MDAVTIVHYLFYFVAITLHASYAIVVGILTHKGFLVKFDGNHFMIFEGALGALLLTGLLLFALRAHSKTGHFSVPKAQIGLIFLFALNETFFAAVGFNDNKHLDCQVDASGDPNPCVFRPLIFGLIFSACIILISYFSGVLIQQFTCLRGTLSHPSSRQGDIERAYTQELRPIPSRRHVAPPTFSIRQGRKKDQRIPSPLATPRNKPVLVDVPLSATRSQY